MPAEIVQRTDRIAEEVGLERLADLALPGRVLLFALGILALVLTLIERVITVEAGILTVLLGAQQRTCIELRVHDRRQNQQQAERQKRERYAMRRFQHDRKAGIRGKGN